MKNKIIKYLNINTSILYMSMNINFPIQMYDPKREYKNNKLQIDKSIQNVLNHGLFINGPEVKQLEIELAKFCNTKHCICVSNGTDAIKISLLSLNIGIGDEVITVAYTWISTVEVISLIGAKPVFVDINPDDFTIDISKIEEKINKNTKAILPVSLYGNICNMDELNSLASKYNIPIIEDGAQSFGSEYKGKKSCSLSTIGTTSFFPSKPLGCYGDGGACFTNDDNIAEKIKMIKNHGCINRFKHKYIGLNARLDTIQASILLVKLNYFKEIILKRNKCVEYYNEKLEHLKKYITFPINKNNVNVWAQYSLLVKNKEIRDNIVSHLKKNNVNVSIFYPSPLHTQECFKYLNYKYGTLPVTENICDTVFNLPCYAEITINEQDYIINLLTEYFGYYCTL
jgi:UDP-2-acetamido-2-deoxy-ribo-hexuluronate aminotransferase